VAKRHPPEVRAAAVAAVKIGDQPAAVARRFGISQGRLTEWCQRDLPELSGSPGGTPGAYVRERERTELLDLVEEFVSESLTTLSAQARLARDPAWFKKQSALGIAEYRGVELDRLIRILPAFRPADDEPGEPTVIEATADDVP
jgi:transposase-like protein